jgi:transcriptional regulator with XRE-family HTH domain
VKRTHEPYLKFKAFLIENNIRQAELAEQLKKSVSALNQNINGTGGDFNLKELRFISSKYGISIDEYFINLKVSNMKLKRGGNL